MTECSECGGKNFIKKFCHATETFEYDDCWDCLSEEMYQAELEERMKVIISDPSEGLSKDHTRKQKRNGNNMGKIEGLKWK
jgi:hypothetical protein